MACVDMERIFVAQLKGISIAVLAQLRPLSDHTTRLSKQQYIPAALTGSAEGIYSETQVPPHELASDDTMRAVPDAVDRTTFGGVIPADPEPPSRAVYGPNVKIQTIAAAHTQSISLQQSRIND
jgi:hypothetical protein